MSTIQVILFAHSNIYSMRCYYIILYFTFSVFYFLLFSFWPQGVLRPNKSDQSISSTLIINRHRYN